jgi:RimJ/RimL family protein N-acetyltransferase
VRPDTVTVVDGWRARLFGIDPVALRLEPTVRPHGVLGDIGTLVAREARGRGLAVAVGCHAAAVAVRRHGIARWRAAETNHASLAVADHLGFTPWCQQPAVR